MTEDRPTTGALTYHIDEIAELVTLTYRSQPSFEEWSRLMLAALNDPRYRPGVSILSDRLALVDTASPRTIRMMAEFVSRHSDRFARCKWAVVVAPDRPAEYGMARMGSALFQPSGIELAVFTDLVTANAWLRRGVTARHWLP
jgi:hypothetical protein